VAKVPRSAYTLTEFIKMRHDVGFTDDAIYESLVSRYGLYGIAFFGHKGTTFQRRKLNYIWKRILEITGGSRRTRPIR
jgi:hypothetical protein